MNAPLHTTDEIIASCRAALAQVNGWRPVSVKCNSKYGGEVYAQTATVPMPPGLSAAISAYKRAIKEYVGGVVTADDE